MNIAAMQQLAEQRAPLYRLAVGLTRDAGWADDLVQESMLKALQHREKFKAGSDLGAWMRTILRHLFINQYRRLRLTRRLEGDMEHHGATAWVAAGRADDPMERLALKEVEASVDRLRPALGEPFRMFREGFKYHEVATELGLPIGTVKSRIHQARQQLAAAVAGAH